MKFLFTLLMGILLISCDVIPEEGTIIYDVDIPPNIPPSLTTSTRSITINENGGSYTVLFSIAAQPKSNSSAILVVSNPNPSRLSASADKVVFSYTAWGTKSITFTGINE